MAEERAMLSQQIDLGFRLNYFTYRIKNHSFDILRTSNSYHNEIFDLLRSFPTRNSLVFDKNMKPPPMSPHAGVIQRAEHTWIFHLSSASTLSISADLRGREYYEQDDTSTVISAPRWMFRQSRWASVLTCAAELSQQPVQLLNDAGPPSCTVCAGASVRFRVLKKKHHRGVFARTHFENISAPMSFARIA